VFYAEDRFTYETALNKQLEDSIAAKGPGDLDALLRGTNTWQVKG
jgi:hypothetical protein